jgi:hypothetical protein
VAEPALAGKKVFPVDDLAEFGVVALAAKERPAARSSALI